ncbi:DUF2799 domain-containing protein [Hyphococcus sp.]|jgi:hypothetical protein|uniref:DUF2799 domain-containing protein n=1 Tax=Hyphococcus sp. TaxID=2038636 RepID=UPI003D122AAE
MSEKECLAGDWYGAGFADGADGKLERAFEERALACHEHEVGADERAYEAGRLAGLDRLCTDPGGYDFGRAGKTYFGVCGRDREEDFLSGYISGQRIYMAQAARDAAKSAYDSAVSRADSYRYDIRRARKKLDDPDATEKEIKNAREDLDDARERLPDAERDIDAALYELGRADEALEQTIGSSGAWAQSREFAAIRAGLGEAHEFARAHPAIDFCADDFDGFYARCEVLYSARLPDSETGEICAVGPGEARFLTRSVLGPGEGGRIRHHYQFFPADPENGRTSRRPVGGFDVFFAMNGDYEGLACGVAP